MSNSIPIRDYLAQRRADVQGQIKALRAELTEIDVAERALLAAAGEPAPLRRERGTAGSGSRKTLKEMAVEVLQDHPSGLEATAILAEIEARYGLMVRRESLSPQLSRLSQEGALGRDGLTWKLANYDWSVALQQAQNNEAPDAATSDAPFSEWDTPEGLQRVEIDDETPF